MFYKLLPAIIIILFISASNIISNAQTLKIDSNPQGANVLLDSVLIGTTPFEHTFKGDDKTLKFIHPDGIHITILRPHITTSHVLQSLLKIK